MDKYKNSDYLAKRINGLAIGGSLNTIWLFILTLKVIGVI